MNISFPTVKLEMKEAIWVLFCALGDVFFKEVLEYLTLIVENGIKQ